MKTNEDILRMVRQVVFEINQSEQSTRKQLIADIERAVGEINVTERIKVHSFVYQTTDMSIFKDIPENRVVKETTKQFRDLMDSIRTNGVISCVLLNEKNQVVDGQRRIAAIRKMNLNLAVPFNYSQHSGIDTVTEANRFNDKWNYKDYLHRYTVGEVQDYIDYQKIAEKYERYMRSRSLRGLLMNCKVDALKLDVWTSGGFKIDRENLHTNVEYLKMLARVFDFGGKQNIFAKSREFQKALYSVYRDTPKIDVERLIFKIQWGFGELNIRTDFRSYKKILAGLYNKRLPQEKEQIVGLDMPELPMEEKPVENKKNGKKKSKENEATPAEGQTTD